MTTLGLWISHPPGHVLAPGYLEQVRELGVRTVAVMVDTMVPGWDPQWTDRQVHHLAARCLQRDLELIITCWPDPSEAGIDRMIVDIDRWCRYGAAGVEVDIEGGWYVRDGGRRRLHPRYDAASAYLVTRLREIAGARQVRTELTTHTGHREITVRAQVTPHVHRLALQLYSVYRSHGVTYAWDHPSRGPGRAQRRGVQLARRVPEVASERVRLTAGLAAWGQSWPGHSLREAVSTALAAALEAHPVEVRYWDSRAVLGRPVAEVIEAEWSRLSSAA